MARQISEMQSLPFHQIIGAPLLAIVQGQAQSAQVTAEFIEKIGFHIPEGADTDDLGRLRMMSFAYQKPDTEGNLQNFKVELPLLSMVPIPAIQVKDADLEFNIKVTDIQKIDARTVMSSPDATVEDWLSQGRVEFRAAMGKLDAATTASSNVDLQMKVKMRVEQADITAGMAFLFRLMDQSISSNQVEQSESE